MSPLVTYSIMAVAAVGMIWANMQYKNKGVPWGRPLAGLLGIVAVCLAFYSIADSLFGFSDKGETAKLVERENQYTRIGFERLGTYLGTNYPKAKAVLVTNIMYPNGDPNVKDPNSRDTMMLDALKKGIGDRLDIIHTKNFGPKDMPGAPGAKGDVSGGAAMPPPMMMMPEMMITAKDWDDMLKEFKDADMFITLAGLPMDVEKMKLWNMKEADRPKVVLVNAQQLSMLYKLIEKGYIQVVLHPNPAAPYDPKKLIPEDPKEAFNDRWLLITPENVKETATKNKGLFNVEFKDSPTAAAPSTATPETPKADAPEAPAKPAKAPKGEKPDAN